MKQFIFTESVLNETRQILEKLGSDSGFGHLSDFYNKFEGIDVFGIMKKIHELEYIYSSLRIKQELTDDENVLFQQAKTALPGYTATAEQILRIGLATWMLLHFIPQVVGTAIDYYASLKTRYKPGDIVPHKEVYDETGLQVIKGRPYYVKYGMSIDLSSAAMKTMSTLYVQPKKIMDYLFISPGSRYTSEAEANSVRIDFINNLRKSDIEKLFDSAMSEISEDERHTALMEIMVGYDPAFGRVFEVYKEILHPGEDLPMRIVNVNLALHVAHHNGQMSEYVGLSEKQLSELSSLPIKYEPGYRHRYLKKLYHGVYEDREELN